MDSPSPSDDVIMALNSARTTACPGWCSNTGPGLHSHCILDALRSLPVEQRMEAMGMVAVGWTFPESGSGYFCGGPRSEVPKEMPLVYAEHDVAWRKEAHRGTGR